MTTQVYFQNSALKDLSVTSNAMVVVHNVLPPKPQGLN